MNKDQFHKALLHRNPSALEHHFEDFVSTSDKSVPHAGSPTRKLKHLRMDMLLHPEIHKKTTAMKNGDMVVHTVHGNVRFWRKPTQTNESTMTSQPNGNKIYYQFGARRVNLYHPKDGLIGSREFSNAPGHGETMNYKGQTHKLVHLKHGAKMEESTDSAEIISQLNDIIGESKRFFSYTAPEPEKDAPKSTRMTRKEWEQLSPGVRREISRQAKKKPFGESTKDRTMNENTKFPIHATKRRVNDAIKRGIESGKITPDEAKSMKLVHHSGELHGLIGYRGNGTDYESVTFHHSVDRKTPYRHVIGSRDTVKSGSHFDRFKKPFTFGANMDESFDDEYDMALEAFDRDNRTKSVLDEYKKQGYKHLTTYPGRKLGPVDLAKVAKDHGVHPATLSQVVIHHGDVGNRAVMDHAIFHHPTKRNHGQVLNEDFEREIEEAVAEIHEKMIPRPIRKMIQKGRVSSKLQKRTNNLYGAASGHDSAMRTAKNSADWHTTHAADAERRGDTERATRYRANAQHDIERAGKHQMAGQTAYGQAERLAARHRRLAAKGILKSPMREEFQAQIDEAVREIVNETTYYPSHVEDYMNGKGDAKKAKGYYSALHKSDGGPDKIRKEHATVSRFLKNPTSIKWQADALGHKPADVKKRAQTIHDHLSSLIKENP